MRLLIDIGNTRIKYGVHDGHAWLCQYAFAHAQGIAFDLSQWPGVRAACAVSVADLRIRAAVERELSAQGVHTEWFASSSSAGGLRNAYANPSQLGADRWAAAIGAWQRVKSACVVVGAGTATTIDLVSADGVFRGGCILPGLDMMRRALAQGTAALPLADGRFCAVPDNTLDAIHSGCLQAQLGAIVRMCAQAPGARLLLSGGAAPVLSPHLEIAHVMAPWLVLEGLLAVS